MMVKSDLIIYFSNKRAKIRNMEIKTVITNSYEFMSKVDTLAGLIQFWIKKRQERPKRQDSRGDSIV